MFIILKIDFFKWGFSTKVTSAFLLKEKL